MISALILGLAISVTGDPCDDLRIEADNISDSISGIENDRASIDSQVNSDAYVYWSVYIACEADQATIDSLSTEISNLDPGDPDYEAMLSSLQNSLTYAQAQLSSDSASLSYASDVWSTDSAYQYMYYNASNAVLTALYAAQAANAQAQTDNGC